MESEAQIGSAARKHGIVFAGRPTLAGSEDETYVVIIDRETNPSRLKAFLKELRNAGVMVNTRYANVQENPFEAALKSSLEASFSDQIVSTHVSITPDRTTVAIQYLEGDQIDGGQLRAHVEELASLFGIERLQVVTAEKATKPGATEFLQLVRIIAPATCTSIQERIATRGYPTPDLEWINHQFDLQRKKGFLLRRADSSYVLTSRGLTALGSSKGRLSPDVRRILELGRREQ